MSKPAPDEIVNQLKLQGIAPGSYDFTPLSGLRKLIAARMVQAVNSAPHYSLHMKIEMDALLALRKRLNAASNVRITVNDCFIKAAALVLKACPAVNASFTDKGIVTHHHADIAFAVAMEGGLVTPIVRSAETKSLTEIAAETQALAERGRKKQLSPDEYCGGSFSISNLGMYGVSSFDAIINQPQSAILSVGAAEEGFVTRNGEMQTATRLTATLTCDHRVIDGALGSEWLQKFKQSVETPDNL